MRKVKNFDDYLFEAVAPLPLLSINPDLMSLQAVPDPKDSDAYFEPAEDKIYRHPTFYNVPDGISHM